MSYGGVMVEELPSAAPVSGLISALRRADYEVAKNRDAAARIAATAGSAALRITPHLDNDTCGYQGTHAAYSLTWAIPMLCPLQHVTDSSPQELARVQRACSRCGAEASKSGQPDTSTVHLAWWDLTTPQTLRAEPVPTEDLLRAHAWAKKMNNSSKYKMPMPEPYKWVDLADSVYFWEEANPKPNLAPMEALAVAGVRRFLTRLQMDEAEQEVRRLLGSAHAAGAGPTTLAKLSGVSRRTIPNWLRAVATA
ncbi:hypothetical protein [Streptomyces misionensis]|uniref:hypothetical protein n=1 Tax=Streptomyces misionensis TaxID=67331 RepID=UPI00369C7AA1